MRAEVGADGQWAVLSGGAWQADYAGWPGERRDCLYVHTPLTQLFDEQSPPLPQGAPEPPFPQNPPTQEPEQQGRPRAPHVPPAPIQSHTVLLRHPRLGQQGGPPPPQAAPTPAHTGGFGGVGGVGAGLDPAAIARVPPQSVWPAAPLLRSPVASTVPVVTAAELANPARWSLRASASTPVVPAPVAPPRHRRRCPARVRPAWPGQQDRCDRHNVARLAPSSGSGSGPCWFAGRRRGFRWEAPG